MSMYIQAQDPGPISHVEAKAPPNGVPWFSGTQWPLANRWVPGGGKEAWRMDKGGGRGCGSGQF